jgi:hypothetical protein
MRVSSDGTIIDRLSVRQPAAPRAAALSNP